MTVSYQYEVASSTSGGFTRLLFMWRGSLYKLIYRELILFLILFGSISALYRHVFTNEQKKSFEQIVVYCDTFINLIPLSFVLGFYVAYVAGRWWQQYTAIPWPDKVMHSVALYIGENNDEYSRKVRRALMRYLNLSLILVLRSISSAVKRRFPTLDHVVDSGFMTSLELELFISVPSVEFNTYWIPCTWFINLLKEAKKNHTITSAQGLKIIMEEFNEFRSKCGMLWSYDWVSIPLVYTQVVTLATYSFFAVALVGRQYIEGASKQFQMQMDVYFPFFTVLQFFFFMGLLKVAEQLINPFGDDDEDFELNWLIDRHTKVSYLGVDTLMNRCPPLVKDIYFDSENLILPYTEAAAAYKRKTYRGSVANMTVPEEKQTMFLPNIMEEEETATTTATPRASSASLAVHNESPPAGIRRQGGTPRHSSRLAPSETILTMDPSEDPNQQQQQQSEQQSQPEANSSIDDAGKATNGRPSSAFSEAVKMFATKGKITEHLLSRKPFFALAKTSKVSIQPWPSATNLKSDSAIGSEWTEDTGTQTGFNGKRIKQSKSFNIPSIDVRQSSVDEFDDDYDDDIVDRVEKGSIGSASRRSSQAIFDARAGTVNRGFLCREASIEETREPSSQCNCDFASSSSGCHCHDSSCSQQPQSLQQIRSASRAKRRTRARAAHSFPKFLAKRQRFMAVAHRPGMPMAISLPRQQVEERVDESLSVSKSSPELTLAVEFGASTSATGERVRARFFTGHEEDDEDDELESVGVKKS